MISYNTNVEKLARMNNRFFIKLESLDNELRLHDGLNDSLHFGRLFDEYGFLIDDSFNSAIIDIEGLSKLPGAIVVAEAGMGKSFVMKCIYDNFPSENSLFLEPMLFSNNMQEFENELIGNDDKQHIIIDGLDENTDVIPLLIRLKKMLLIKTNLIFSSRNIKEIKLLKERLNLPVYALLPLSRELVILLAQEAKIDGSVFFDCVKQKGLSSI